MLILYTAEGRPYATVNDPVPEGYREFLAGEGTRFIEAVEVPSDLFTSLYVADGELVDRPVFDVAEDISLAVGETVSLNLPVGTSVSVDGEAPVVLETTPLEITGEMPAAYTLGLENWPYVSLEIKVNVHEA